MAVEAVVALMVHKLAELADTDTQLLGMHGEVNRIRKELDNIGKELDDVRPFLKDADIKQKEDEAVRVWMKDLRYICFDVDDVIDILGQGQAAQERHGFVERLKRCISDQITRYKVGKEIERIKLSINGIKSRRESCRIREINKERPEAASSTQRLQEVRCYVPLKKEEIVIPTVDDQLPNEGRTRDIEEGRQEASSSSRNLQAHRRVSTLPGEPEEVCLREEINTVCQQLIEEEPRLWDGTRDISEGKLEASSSTPGLKADRRFSTLLGDSEEVGLQEGINTVDQQLIKEEPGPYDGTRDIDEGRLEASSSAPNLQADRWFSTLLGESEEVGLQEGIDRVSEGESEAVGLPEVIDTVSEQSIKEEPGPYDGTRYIDEVRFEASSLAPSIQASFQVGLQEEIDTVSGQLIKEEPSPCDGTRVIDEGPECRDGSKKRKIQPKRTEQVPVSSGPSLEGPSDDGHSWRKYGQKETLGAKYPRAYYRCTHRNVQGCAAKKQVQRSEEDPSIFQVMYQGHHTCMQATSVIRGASPASPELKEQQQQQPQQGVLLNFKTGLKVRTEDLDTQGVNSSSFSFPHASIQGANVGECIFSSSSLDSPFMSTFSPPFMSPATSGSNYFSSVSPCHMNSYGGGGSTSMPTAGTSDINEIISAVTSGSNSSLVDLEFSLDQFDASTFLS